MVVLCRGSGRHVLRKVREFLSRLRLTVNEEKTRVVRATEGFDFLGMTFRYKKAIAWIAWACTDCRTYGFQGADKLFWEGRRRAVLGKTRRPVRRGKFVDFSMAKLLRHQRRKPWKTDRLHLN